MWLRRGSPNRPLFTEERSDQAPQRADLARKSKVSKLQGFKVFETLKPLKH
jgi:hypothetical protein